MLVLGAYCVIGLRCLEGEQGGLEALVRREEVAAADEAGGEEGLPIGLKAAGTEERGANVQKRRVPTVCQAPPARPLTCERAPQLKRALSALRFIGNCAAAVSDGEHLLRCRLGKKESNAGDTYGFSSYRDLRILALQIAANVSKRFRKKKSMRPDSKVNPGFLQVLISADLTMPCKYVAAFIFFAFFSAKIRFCSSSFCCARSLALISSAVSA